MVREDPALHDAIVMLWELAESRSHETQQVLDGSISVQHRLLTMLFADIHGFTALGQVVFESYLNAFLFDFIERADEIIRRHGGEFADQGDGFLALFAGEQHPERATLAALEVRDAFLEVRAAAADRDDTFNSVGLGIAAATECVALLRRERALRPVQRVVGHAISVVAAVAKQRTRRTEISVRIDEATASMLPDGLVQVSPATELHIDKLDRTLRLHTVDALAPRNARQTPKTVATARDSSPQRPPTSLARSTPVDTPATSSAGYMMPPRDQAERPADDAPIHIVFAAADPSNLARLRVEQEAREIEDTLRLARSRDRFLLTRRSALRAEDLSQLLLDVAPNVVHFSGHGTETGGLCFEDRAGNALVVSAHALGSLFREFAGSVRCVVLNACWSLPQANAIAAHVPFVIAMHADIGDDAAIAFAIGLYQALGAGKSFPEAYRLGCVQIGLAGMDDEARTPILLGRSVAQPE